MSKGWGGVVSEWQPGDPIYADERDLGVKHCGLCMVSWTADVDYCDCGLPTTERLLADLARMVDENADLRDELARLRGAS